MLTLSSSMRSREAADHVSGLMRHVRSHGPTRLFARGSSCVSSRERIDRSFISWSATRRSLH